MTSLQQLLDERWPIPDDASEGIKDFLNERRGLFSAGYNARIAEENTPVPGNPKYDLKKVLDECRSLITDGQSLKALRLYKETMGSSLMEAKAVLNL